MSTDYSSVPIKQETIPIPDYNEIRQPLLVCIVYSILSQVVASASNMAEGLVGLILVRNSNWYGATCLYSRWPVFASDNLGSADALPVMTCRITRASSVVLQLMSGAVGFRWSATRAAQVHA